MSRAIRADLLQGRTYVILPTPIQVPLFDGPITWMKPCTHDAVTKLGIIRGEHKRVGKPCPCYNHVELVDVEPIQAPPAHHAWSMTRSDTLQSASRA